MNWPDGLGPWPKGAPDTQREECEDCDGDRLFCNACDQPKSKCECSLGCAAINAWLCEVFGVSSANLIAAEDAAETFADEDYRFSPCTFCEEWNE